MQLTVFYRAKNSFAFLLAFRCGIALARYLYSFILFSVEDMPNKVQSDKGATQPG